MTDGKCGSVLGYESGKFKEERSDRHLLTSYHSWYVRGAAAYVSSRFSRTCSRQTAEAPRFCCVNQVTTILH